jgi:hypothetical protein
MFLTNTLRLYYHGEEVSPLSNFSIEIYDSSGIAVGKDFFLKSALPLFTK